LVGNDMPSLGRQVTWGHVGMVVVYANTPELASI
jgi:hypothetical protein